MVVEFLEDWYCQSQTAYLNSYSFYFFFFFFSKLCFLSQMTASSASLSGLMCSACALLAVVMLVLSLYQDSFRGNHSCLTSLGVCRRRKHPGQYAYKGVKPGNYYSPVVYINLILHLIRMFLLNFVTYCH